MKTPNVTEEEFRSFLDREYLFPDQVLEDGDEPIVLDDGIYYGNKEDKIFRFQIKEGVVISLTDITPEEIRLEDIESPNSGIDCLFQNWLSNSASEDYARRWIVSFCTHTEIQTLSKNQRTTIDQMFKYANVPWLTFFEWRSSLGPEDKEAIVGCTFVMTAIKSGIFPWGFE